jgi:hypothetical protein
MSTRDRVIEGTASYQEARDFVERLEARSLELDRTRDSYRRLLGFLALASPQSLMDVTEREQE